MAASDRKGRRYLARILDLLAEFPEGLSVGMIAEELARRHRVTLAPNAIAYRLRRAPAGVVEALGRGKGRRYRLAARPHSTAPATASLASPTEPTPESTSWLTREGADLRAAIKRPRAERRYVTYQRPWLDAYTPGVTWYLAEGMRAHLHRIGSAGVDDRPAGTFARNVLSRLLIDLSWASSRLEGNTYSRLDTQNLIEFGKHATGKDAAESQMILNHKAAIEFLVGATSPPALDELTIRSLHALLAEGLVRQREDEGRLRTIAVSITGTTYIPSGDPHTIRESFARIVALTNAIADPFERSFFLLVHLPYLQPFVDVNKRTSRLAANIPLIEANLCPLTFVDVPERDYVDGILAVYELQRTELLRDLYLHAYERSCEQYLAVRQSTPAPDPIRLRYRAALQEIVAETIRGGNAPDRDRVTRWGAAHGVPAPDTDAFAETVLSILLSLNDASAARYGIRPAEFLAWRTPR